MNETLKNTIDSLPEKPGCYQYFDKSGTIIYVGKAKNLKRRVSSYFNRVHESRKTNALVKQIESLQYIVVNSEEDALLLENNLIKKYQPHYNVLLKDGKTYPSICIKNEKFPRVFKTRNIVKDGSKYFGPYSSNYTIDTILDLIHKFYPIRTCKHHFTDENVPRGTFKVCLEYHIKNCGGPCQGLQSEEEYMKNIDEIEKIIKGNSQEICNRLLKEMQQLAEEYRFEEAADLKKKYDAIENYKSKSIITNTHMDDTDVFGYDEDENSAFVNILRISKGCIVQGYTIEYKKKMEESREELLTLGIIELRERLQSDSKEILVPFALEMELNGCNFSIPERGDRKKLLELAHQNVLQYKFDKLKQAEKLNPEQRTTRILKAIKEMLKLEKMPMHIECFDNSNIQGSDAVASCVVFKKAKPSKKDYRHYNIKTVTGPDDYASMQEIVKRRYSRLQEESAPLPDLIITDGGKGQMEAVRKVIEDELHLHIPIAGLVKDNRHRTSELLFGFPQKAIGLKTNDELFKLLANIQDEAHRFAITFHRKKRSKSQIASELDNINGIGEKTKTELLKNLKSIKRIREAKLEDLEKIVGKSKATLIFEYFNKNNG
ncbi:MAG: excinuclease ABC subunit UvrC [Paludibacteraceae bacterium]|jgi:excinuclease ABC subunit C|nr:excinuclease ABC subunit UvrC [Paludibacteraceae bacterium]